MIDFFIIFTKGGLVLWKYELSPIEGDPIAHLIQEVLIQEKQGLESFNFQNYHLRWTFANEYDLIFVACVLKFGKVNNNIDDILVSTKETFLNMHKTALKLHNYQLPYQFESYFNKIVDMIEHSSKQKAPTQPKKDLEKITPSLPETNLSIDTTNQPDANLPPLASPMSTTSNPLSDGGEEGEGDVDGENSLEVQRLLRIQMRREQRQANQQKAKEQTPSSGKGKQQTKWDNSKVSKDEANSLDMSENKTDPIDKKDLGLSNNYGISQKDVDATIASHGSAPVKGENYWEYKGGSPEDTEITLKRAEEEASSGAGIWGYFQGLVGQKELTKEDLVDISKQFTQRLVNKNVSPEIADKLVESVISGLVGKKLGTFNTMYSTIRASLEESLTRLLTPKKPIDVLTGIANAKLQNRPYSIVFCGVNGVGKSTSLSKIAAFFLSQGLTVGVAACDTFRSGAIEQLKTHCSALKIPLYDKGYGRDEATVAADGIMNAKKDGLDVILIDTAGRMQGNDPLMKGLARLMNVNEPDLILFVGEALVGNDGCDQLINFNRALRENSGKQHPRLVDGIVLTKFDTIDDKVGTAINMIYSTGQPIVFVGTGQTYRDLKRPNPRLFIDALFK